MRPRARPWGDKMEEQLQALQAKVEDTFSLKVIDAARRALADGENPLRANFFASAMRTLFEHTMATWAPDPEVKTCSWYKAERDNGEPTRAQRIKFAIHGGFSDDFVAEKLKVDPTTLSKHFLVAVDALSKQVHGREDTIIEERAAQDAFAIQTLQAMLAFFDTALAARAEIVRPIEETLSEAAVGALMEETLQVVDELASHYSLEEVYVDNAKVLRIGAETITYRASGSVNVILQWGSNSDLRRGDGAELSETFPAICDITVPIDDPWDLSMAETEYGVDTSEWRKAMAPEQEWWD